MFGQVRVPIVGVVENMSAFVCPHCGASTPIFRQGGGRKASEREEVPLLGQVPLDPVICEGGDLGTPIVAADPQGPQAAALRAVAGEVAARLSVLAHQS
jgi:ATP-binding protein involved in chromosome partitioning